MHNQRAGLLDCAGDALGFWRQTAHLIMRLAPVGAFEDTIPDAFVAVVEVAVDEGIAFDGVPTSGFSTLGYEVLDEMVPINIARSFPRKTLFSNYYIDMFLLEQQTCQD